MKKSLLESVDTHSLIDQLLSFNAMDANESYTPEQALITWFNIHLKRSKATTKVGFMTCSNLILVGVEELWAGYF